MRSCGAPLRCRSSNLRPACGLCLGLALLVKGAKAGVAPAGAELGGRRLVVAVLQIGGEFEEGAEEGGAVVVHQLDETSLGDEAAELDEMTGAVAARSGPVAGVRAGLGSLGPCDGLATPPPGVAEAEQFGPEARERVPDRWRCCRRRR